MGEQVGAVGAGPSAIQGRRQIGTNAVRVTSSSGFVAAATASATETDNRSPRGPNGASRATASTAPASDRTSVTRRSSPAAASSSASSRRFSSTSSTTTSGASVTIAATSGFFVPPTVGSDGCSQKRVQATTSAPAASSVSVADGTRLTTRGRTSVTAEEPPLLPFELVGVSVPRPIIPSSFSSWEATSVPPTDPRPTNLRFSFSSIWAWIWFLTRSGLRMSVNSWRPSSPPDSMRRSPAPIIRSRIDWLNITLFTRSSGISIPFFARTPSRKISRSLVITKFVAPHLK